MKINKHLIIVTALASITSLALAIPIYAQTSNPQPTSNANGAWTGERGPNAMGRGQGMMKPGVMGTVTAINGNSITISGRQGFGSTSPLTTFMVDATNAKITKNNAASTISSIMVGDTIFAQGTVTGSTVTATMIRDGVMPNRTGRPMNGQGGMSKPDQTETTSLITGNGQPVVAGTVTAVSGNLISITNKSNVSYTVDTSSAKIVHGQNTITVSGIIVGDNIIVQGTVNGTAVTASSVIDQGKPAATIPATGNTMNNNDHPGFFGSIGRFFSHLFGF